MTRSVPRQIWILGLVSFFTDLSSEMIYPLLPAYIAVTLGQGPLILGLIEGIAESTAAALKLVSGLWADRGNGRQPLVVVGYTIANLSKALTALATSWPFLLVLRFSDRVGKGIRTAPRDAMISDYTLEGGRGSAYGIHRSMDHLGGLGGALIATLLLAQGLEIREVFWLAALPAMVSVAIVISAVRDKKTSVRPIRVQTLKSQLQDWRRFPPELRRLILAAFIFALANSSDAFLLLRLTEAGVQAAWIPLLWALLHVVRVTATYWGGGLADRHSHRKLIGIGWLVFAAVYLILGWVHSEAILIVVFLAYGLFAGFTEPAERSWIADSSSEDFKGSAFGYFHGATAIGALPASLALGALWQSFGSGVALSVGAGCALIATAILWWPRGREIREP